MDNRPECEHVQVNDGKYTVVLHDKDGLSALRHGEKWRDCVGDNLIYWLAVDLKAARHEIARLNSAIARINENGV